MFKSVLFTGDAGGLDYLNKISEEKSQTIIPSLNCCCTKESISNAEDDLAPIRRSIKKSP